MKKFLCILFSILIIVSVAGCRNDKSGELNKIKFSEFKDPIIIYVMQTDNLVPRHPDGTEVADWESYMKEKYRVSIDLTYVINDTDSEAAESSPNIITYSEFIGEPDKEGLIYADNLMFEALIGEGIAVPVNPYIPKIELMGVMNDKIIKSFTDGNGDVWAVPFSDYVNLETRLYCREWLGASNSKVPVDLKDYLDFAEFTANYDPDGNGVQDTYIQEYLSPEAIFRSMADIFRAFGCYPVLGPFGYNPLTGQIENVMLNENFPEAISYIRNMIDSGLLRKGRAEERSGREAEYMVASQMSYGEFPAYWEDWEAGFYILGPNDTALAPIQWGTSGYMIIEGTDNAAEMLNALGEIGGMESGLYDLQFGREGYNYTVGSNYIDVTRTNEDDSPRVPIGLFYGSRRAIDAIYENGRQIILDGDTEALEVRNIMYERAGDINARIQLLLESDITYSTPYYVTYSDLWDLYKEASHETGDAMQKILIVGTDIDLVIDEYRTKLEDKGVIDMLDDLNR